LIKSNKTSYIFNTTWMLSEKIVRICLVLLVMVWLARYLGPQEFGKLNFALSFVALFGIFSTLGLDKLLVKELLQKPDENFLIMGSALTLRIIGGLILVLVSIWIAHLIRPDDKVFKILVLILSSAHILNSFEVIKYWFESNVQAKYSAIIDLIVVITGSIARVILIMNGASLITFGWVVLFESMVLCFGLLVIYQLKYNSLSKWKSSFRKILSLLKSTLPLILAGAAFILFTRIDQVMLGEISGDSSVGLYAAAVRLSEGWMFVPALIATSLFPALLDARSKNYELYLMRIQHLLNLMVFFSVIVSILFTFISSPLINFIYGPNYSQTSVILSIHIWGMVFNTISIVSFRYFLVEGMQIFSFYRALAGLIINIGLNLWLIPLYGAVGAAIATVIAQIIAAYLLNYASPKSREMFNMQTKALTLRFFVKSYLYVRNSK
jgi:O-antigen/teichoic acid export membrane protein